MHVPTSIVPHGNEPVLFTGNTSNPFQVLILIHGRGGSAQDILHITEHLNLSSNVLVLAPQASLQTWYPERFIEPQITNQPGLDSALERIETLITFVETEFKVPSEHIALAGFSQGACLTAEYIKRHPKRYLAAAIYSGGLIGDETEVVQPVEGLLEGTPMYIGCDAEDFHIPSDRVRTTASYMTTHGAQVTVSFYSGLGHTIHGEGLEFLKGVFEV